MEIKIVLHRFEALIHVFFELPVPLSRERLAHISRSQCEFLPAIHFLYAFIMRLHLATPRKLPFHALFFLHEQDRDMEQRPFKLFTLRGAFMFLVYVFVIFLCVFVNLRSGIGNELVFVWRQETENESSWLCYRR